MPSIFRKFMPTMCSQRLANTSRKSCSKSKLQKKKVSSNSRGTHFSSSLPHERRQPCTRQLAIVQERGRSHVDSKNLILDALSGRNRTCHIEKSNLKLLRRVSTHEREGRGKQRPRSEKKKKKQSNKKGSSPVLRSNNSEPCKVIIVIKNVFFQSNSLQNRSYCAALLLFCFLF